MRLPRGPQSSASRTRRISVGFVPLISLKQQLCRAGATTGPLFFAAESSSSQLPNIPKSLDPTPNDAVPKKLTLAMQTFTLAKIVLEHVPFFRRKNRRNIRVGGRNKGGRPRWMKSDAFKGLCQWAFTVCDDDGNGYIRRQDLYSGILLVHLNLAKYVGVAATHPLNRTQVDDLFELADVDDHGAICLSDFEQIVVASCLNIGGRIVVYWCMLAFFAPFVTARLVQVAARVYQTLDAPPTRRTNVAWAAGEWIVGHAVSVFIFTAAVPWIIERIDRYSPKLIPRRRKKPWWQKLRPDFDWQNKQMAQGPRLKTANEANGDEKTQTAHRAEK